LEGPDTVESSELRALRARVEAEYNERIEKQKADYQRELDALEQSCLQRQTQIAEMEAARNRCQSEIGEMTNRIQTLDEQMSDREAHKEERITQHAQSIKDSVLAKLAIHSQGRASQTESLQQTLRALELREAKLQHALRNAKSEIPRRREIQKRRVGVIREKVLSLAKLLGEEIDAVNRMRRTDGLVEFGVPTEEDIAELLSPRSEAPLQAVLDTLRQYFESVGG
jgi:chromosome segregation ATPase